jgi:hypothetical protein
MLRYELALILRLFVRRVFAIRFQNFLDFLPYVGGVLAQCLPSFCFFRHDVQKSTGFVTHI